MLDPEGRPDENAEEAAAAAAAVDALPTPSDWVAAWGLSLEERPAAESACFGDVKADGTASRPGAGADVASVAALACVCSTGSRLTVWGDTPMMIAWSLRHDTQ